MGSNISWEYHDWVTMCSAFHVKKMLMFPFPLWIYAFKRPQVNLAIFLWQVKSGSIFLPWGSGGRQQYKNLLFTQTQQFVCEMRWVEPTFFCMARGINSRCKSSFTWTLLETVACYSTAQSNQKTSTFCQPLTPLPTGVAVSHVCLIKMQIKSE